MPTTGPRPEQASDRPVIGDPRRRGRLRRPGPGRPSVRTRAVTLIMVAALAAATATLVAGGAGATIDLDDDRPCPEMTDSITRLYLAYFERVPDPEGFRYWVDQYRSGVGLEQISDELMRSAEFTRLYGSVTDQEFVELVYRNVLDREPDTAGREHWQQSLGDGYPRGSVMIAFSESEEFVELTGTVTPLAGYLRWYPQGVHWYCGVGDTDALDIEPLVGDAVHTDFAFRNAGSTPDRVGLFTLDGTTRNVTMTAGTLPAGFTDYKWDGVFTGDGDYGSGLEVQAGPRTSWVVVFYPSSIGVDRIGWQITG